MGQLLGHEPRFTSRLILRPFRRKDTSAVHEAVRASLPELAEFLPWAVGYQRSVTSQFIKDSVGAWASGRAFDFAIRDQEDADRHLGNVSVWFTSRANMVGEIGYWIRSDVTGQGIGTEATARALQVAFEELQMHRVTTRIAVGNIASEKIVQKLGFLKEGTLRDEVKVGTRWLDHTVWGILDREWRYERRRYAAESWNRP
jgi:RimJ/RimL family protein N-acetyltransferase